MFALLAVLLLLPSMLSFVTAPMAAPPSPAMALGLSAVALSHPTRAKILTHLQVVPGDHFRSIVRSVRVSVGETRHHLNVLVRSGRIREDRKRNCCRYYVTAEASSDRNSLFEAYWGLKECRSRVLSVVREKHAVRPSDVAMALGISRQLADYHLQRLAAAGMVDRNRGSYRL